MGPEVSSISITLLLVLGCQNITLTYLGFSCCFRLCLLVQCLQSLELTLQDRRKTLPTFHWPRLTFASAQCLAYLYVPHEDVHSLGTGMGPLVLCISVPTKSTQQSPREDPSTSQLQGHSHWFHDLQHHTGLPTVTKGWFPLGPTAPRTGQLPSTTLL